MNLTTPLRTAKIWGYIDNLIGKKQEAGIASLFSKGGGIVSDETFDGIEDFELVSFLVIK